eukprot:Hpha_TRINITY_DN14039_c0_g1::TRINITY_DN14039_c0_g1_i1::g.44274::m.44274/K01195/uidA, GUSB; beta-glucuronidase
MAGHIVLAAAVAAAPPLGFWPIHEGVRRTGLLDGEWAFGLNLEPGFDSLRSDINVTDPVLTPNTTNVPSCFDAAPFGIPGDRGVAFYRRSFKQSEGAARIQFNACGFYCRVWIDGKEVGEHRSGGYVGWFVDIPEVDIETTRELVVLADNRFNSTTAPLHTGGDFWHYGGIFRSVVLHDLPPTLRPLPWRIYITPTEEGYTSGEVNVSVVLANSSFSGDYPMTIAFDTSPTPVTLNPKAVAGVIDLPRLKVPSPRLWELGKGQLHTLRVTSEGGSVTERFGLRWFGKKDGRVTVNGKTVKLHGWNHHMQWNVDDKVTAAATDKEMDFDLDQMQAAGTNYIRGAHYPQDPRWLDRLDERGLVMWEETLGPGVGKAQITDPKWMEQQLKQLHEMMDMSLNHPAILTWGWFNEGCSNDIECCSGYKACSDAARARDPSRFVTWADNHLSGSKCLSHATLISFNNYPGWYNHRGNTTYPGPYWKEQADWVTAHFPGVPWTISETGAGAVYEWTNKTDVVWSQKYQTEVIENDVKFALGESSLSGITLWHYFDFKGNDGATAECGQCQYLPGVEPPTCGYINVKCNRPGGANHKGVVDFWRRPKESYGVVQSLYLNSSLFA